MLTFFIESDTGILDHFIHLNCVVRHLKLDTEIHIGVQNDFIDVFSISVEHVVELLSDCMQVVLGRIQLLVILEIDQLTLPQDLEASK